jgi:hypothetical protein
MDNLMEKIAFGFGASKKFGYSDVKMLENAGYNLILFEDPRREPQNIGRGCYVSSDKKQLPEKYLKIQELLKENNNFTLSPIKYSKNDIIEIYLLNFTEVQYNYSIWLETKDILDWNILNKNVAPVQYDFERDNGLIKLMCGEQKTFKIDFEPIFSKMEINGLFRFSFNFQYKCYNNDKDFEERNCYLEFILKE